MFDLCGLFSARAKFILCAWHLLSVGQLAQITAQLEFVERVYGLNLMGSILGVGRSFVNEPLLAGRP